MSGEDPPAIEVVDLERRYAGLAAVKGVSFKIGRGEAVGFLGPNGAGKSTTLRMLSTFLAPTRGSVRINGHDAFAEPIAARRSLGYLPEGNPLPPEMRVEEYLRYRARLKGAPGRERTARTLEACGLVPVRRRLLGQLSLGYRRRVGLADALVHSPSLLILDEPTSGLDPGQQREVRSLIRAQAPERTVLLSTHRLSEVSRICGRVLVLHQGRLLADEPTRTLEQRFEGGILVELEGPPGALEDSLREWAPGLEPVPEGEDPPFRRFRLEGRADPGLRVRIFQEAARRGWRLRELSQRRNSLEEVFLRMTGSR